MVLLFTATEFMLSQQPDGYLVEGYSFSFSIEEHVFPIYKLVLNGNKVWRVNYGGTSWDGAESIQQTLDGG